MSETAKVHGPNMYYDRLHANGDRTVTFATDQIKVAGETVEKKDMVSHGEAKIQVGKKSEKSERSEKNAQSKGEYNSRYIKIFKEEIKSIKLKKSHYEIIYQTTLNEMKLKSLVNEILKQNVLEKAK